MASTTSYYSVGTSAQGISLSTIQPSQSSITVGGLKAAGKMTVQDIRSAFQGIGELLSEVERAGYKVPQTMTRTQWATQLNSELKDLTSAASALLRMAEKPQTMDRSGLDKLASQIGMSTQQVLLAARNAALSGEEEKNMGLLNAGKAVADSLKLLLEAADKLQLNPQLMPQFTAAQNRYKAALEFLESAMKGQMADPLTQELLTSEGRKIVGAVGGFLDLAGPLRDRKTGAPTDDLDRALKDLEKDTEKLAWAASTFAPAIVLPTVREELTKETQVTEGKLKIALAKAEALADQDTKRALNESASHVLEALKGLANAAQVAESPAGPEATIQFGPLQQELANSIQALKDSVGDRNKLVSSVKNVTGATNKIVAAAKKVADHSDPQTHAALVAAAKKLADEISLLVQHTKASAANPGDVAAHAKVRDAADKLETGLLDLIEKANVTSQMGKVKDIAKKTITKGNNLIMVTRQAAAETSDPKVKEQLLAKAQAADNAFTDLIQRIVKSNKNPGDETIAAELVTAAQNSAMPSMELVAAAKRQVPKINNLELKHSVKEAADDLANTLQELMDNAKTVNKGATELNDSLDEIDATLTELNAAQFALANGALLPTPGQTREDSVALLNVAVKNLGNANQALSTAIDKNPRLIGTRALDAGKSVGQVANAVRSVAAGFTDKTKQQKLIALAKDLATTSQQELQAAKELQADPKNTQAANTVKDAVAKSNEISAELLVLAKGLDAREVDEALKAMQAEEAKIGTTTSSGVTSLDQAQEDLGNYSKALSAAMNQVSNMARKDPKNLGNAAKIASSTIAPLVEAVGSAAKFQTDKQVAERMKEDAKKVIKSAVAVLNYAKATAADSSNAGSLAKASKDVADALHQLLASIGKASNSQVDEAVESIMKSTKDLDDPNAKAGERKPFNTALNDLNDAVRNLATMTGQVVSAARQSPAELGGKSKEVATTVDQIVGNLKNTLIANQGGPSYPPQFEDLTDTVARAAVGLGQHPDDANKVVANARTIAGATQKLIALTKEEAKSETDPGRRGKLLQGAQALASSTANLAKSAKAVQGKQDGAAEQMKQTAQELQAATTALLKASQVASPTGLAAEEQVKITPEDAKKLTDAVRTLATNSSSLLTAAGQVSLRPKDQASSQQMSEATTVLTSAIAKVLKGTSTLQPGVVEVEDTLESVQNAVGDLESTSIAVTVGNVEKPKGTAPLGQVQSEIVASAKKLSANATEVLNASRVESTAALGKATKNLKQNLLPFVAQAKEAVSLTNDPEAQAQLLTLAKDVADSLLALVQSSKTTTLAPSEAAHQDAITKFKNSSAAIEQILSTLASGVDLQRDLDEAVKLINAAPNAAPQGTPNYADAKDEINNLSKALAGAIKKLATVDKSTLVQTGTAAMDLATVVPRIVAAANAAKASTTDKNLQTKLGQVSQQLAKSSHQLILHTKTLTQDTKNRQAQTEVANSLKEVRGAVQSLLSTIKEGAIGERMLEEALEEILKSGRDLDAAALFSAAGQLEEKIPDNLNATTIQKNLITQAKQMAAAALQLVNIAKGPQEELGKAAKSLASLMSQVTVSARQMASLSGDIGAQQQLLNSAKAISIAAHQTVSTGKEVNRFKDDANLLKTLQKSSQTLAESIQTLISFTEENESESAQVIEQLLRVKNELGKLLEGLPTLDPPKAAPFEIIKAARRLAASSALLTSSEGNKEKIIKGCEEGIVSSRDLLTATKGAIKATDKQDVKDKVVQAASKNVSVLANVAAAMKEQMLTRAMGNTVNDESKKMADLLQELVDAVRMLPGAGELKLEEDSAQDLEEVASNELSSAVKMIEAATKSLMAAKPEKQENIKFDTTDVQGAIFDAAIAIAKATTVLVTAAASTQKDRVGKQQQNPSVYRKDPMWANGLISAAKQVAGVTQQLVNSANKAVEGKAQEEELIAVARMVAASTAQLVSASRAKSSDKSHALLQEAAKAVANATSQLVAAAKSATEALNEAQEEELASNYTNSAVKQLEQQMKILKLEKDLERARSSVLNARKKEYQK